MGKDPDVGVVTGIFQLEIPGEIDENEMSGTV